MMHVTLYVTFLTEAAALTYQSLVDKLLAVLVRDVVEVGDGRHAEVHPTVPGPGWTIHHASIRKHPTEKIWAHVVVDPDMLGAAGSLTAAEADALRTDMARAEQLAADWAPDAP